MDFSSLEKYIKSNLSKTYENDTKVLRSGQIHLEKQTPKHFLSFWKKTLTGR